MSSKSVLAGLATIAALAPAAARAGGAVHRCYTTQLVAKPGPANAAAGSIGQTVSLRNTSASACTMSGYPGMLMLSASGHPLATEVHRGASVTVRSRPVRVVTLAPGHSALFDIGYGDATGFANARCPTSARVEITPPNDFAHLTISWRLQPYGGSIRHLVCGLINVSPVYTG
jgi:hypothetical protein